MGYTSKSKTKNIKRTLKSRVQKLMMLSLVIIILLFTAFELFAGAVIVNFMSSSLVTMASMAGGGAISGGELKGYSKREPSELERRRFEDNILRQIESKVPKFLLDNEIINDYILAFSIKAKLDNGDWKEVYKSQDTMFIESQFVLDRLNPNSTITYKDDQTSKLVKDVIVGQPIVDNSNQVVGIFMAKLNPIIPYVVYMMLLIVVIAVSIVSMILARILCSLFTIKISKPIEIITDRMRDLGRNENEFLEDLPKSRIYREVDELSDATNHIFHKYRDLIGTLEGQRDELEAQNEELEAQKDELEMQKIELERTYKELKDAQVQLVQAEKMASLGQLTAGVAHEINTPLGAIHSNIDINSMLLDKLSGLIIYDKDSVEKIVTKLRKTNSTNLIASERIIEIVRTLKNFSRLDEAEFQSACVVDGIESVLLILNNYLKHGIQVIKKFDKVSNINCYPNQLNQVFMNIIVNAIHALEGSEREIKTITISIYEDGSFLVVDIDDNGKGIKEENLGKIFDPGFTTKGVGVGTGLGLSICYNIIQKHNGSIQALSEYGKGATFRIKLPL